MLLLCTSVTIDFVNVTKQDISITLTLRIVMYECMLGLSVCHSHIMLSIVHEQSVNHISLNKKGRPRCYAKSPTAQDAIWPILGLISCAVRELTD